MSSGDNKETMNATYSSKEQVIETMTCKLIFNAGY